MDFRLLAFILLVASGVKCEEDTQNEEVDTTIVLTDTDFQDVIKTNNFFVMFYAPWCGHCTRLKPTWSQLAEMLNPQDESRVRIARVDCTENQKTCSDNGVTSYPTLKFFKTGEAEAVNYRSTRDLPSLTEFINEQLDSAPSDDEEESEEVEDAPKPTRGLVILTEKNFATQTANSNWFIKFYAPWCGHCVKLAPTFDELATSLAHDSTVNIGKIDCTEYRQICKEYDVKGYPTLLWFEEGKKIEKYTGPRSLDDLKSYVEQRLVGEGAEKPAKVELKEDGEGVAVLQLTSESFEQVIETGVTFVKFYAPWCGHCKRLAPTWNQLAEKFAANELVKIAKVDCTLQNNRDLCNEQEVNGFPTLYIYKHGDKISEYNGSRSLDDLHDFVTAQSSDKARDEL